MDQSTRKLLKRRMHIILYKEGLNSDLSDVETWRTLVFLFVCLFVLSISGMIRIKALTGVTFTGEKARRGERVHTLFQQSAKHRKEISSS